MNECDRFVGVIRRERGWRNVGRRITVGQIRRLSDDRDVRVLMSGERTSKR